MDEITPAEFVGTSGESVDDEGMTQLDRVEKMCDAILSQNAEILQFVNMMTAGARNALGQGGMAGVAARAMIPPHLQVAAMNGHVDLSGSEG